MALTSEQLARTINVEGLQAALQEMKTRHIDPIRTGFMVSYDTTTGIKTLTALGAATASFDSTTGVKKLTF